MYVYTRAWQETDARGAWGGSFMPRGRKYGLPAFLAPAFVFRLWGHSLYQLSSYTRFMLGVLWFLVWELLIKTNKFVASRVASSIEIVGATAKFILGTQKGSNLELCEMRIESLPLGMENIHNMTVGKVSCLSPTQQMKKFSWQARSAVCLLGSLDLHSSLPVWLPMGWSEPHPCRRRTLMTRYKQTHFWW